MLSVRDFFVDINEDHGSLGSNGTMSGTYLSATYKHISGGGSNFYSDEALWWDALLVVPTGGIPSGTPFDMTVGVTTTGSGIYGSWGAYKRSGLWPSATYAFADYYPNQGAPWVSPCVGYGCAYATGFPLDPFTNGLSLDNPFQVFVAIDATAQGWGTTSYNWSPGSVSVDTTWNGITNVVNLLTGQPISFQVYSCSGTQY